MNINQKLNDLTLEEKASLCSGLDFWNLKSIEKHDIPSIMLTDGPHGLRKQAGTADHIGFNKSIPATCFPTAVATASSWNADLLKKIGLALGEESRQEKVSVILGPDVNIKRSPLCGRNFEYYSEDPYLTGELAKGQINGIQEMGIGASIKHYAVNNQEHRRLSIDALVDERALREIYLAGFETAIKQSKPYTVMCSYNKVNGTYASEDNYLLNDILREEWGYENLVVTDWGACNDRVKGLVAGQDLEMPGNGGINDKKIVEAVNNGDLSMDTLDKCVRRILELINKSCDTLQSGDYSYDKDEHHQLAKEAATESMVLLKNNENILPISENSKLALIGAFAEFPRYQGAGSSKVSPTKLDTPLDEFIKTFDNVQYAKGYDIDNDEIDEFLIDEAIAISKDVNYVVILSGLPDSYESEGFDREHMRMPQNHNKLIEAISQVNPNVIVCLSNGSPVEMPWIENVKGLIEGYLSGQAGASALVDIIVGKENPSGKLAETFPLHLEDIPCYNCFPQGPRHIEYRESIYVGYRYYDKANVEVLFPFGYGLSYTDYEYNDITLSSSNIKDSDDLQVSIKIKNVGNVFGKEVVQLYVSDVKSSIFRPIKELKGFYKVALEPNEEKEVKFTLNKRAFAYYNTHLCDWQVETGDFKILVGSSSRQIHSEATVHVTSTNDFNEEINLQLKDNLEKYYNPTNDISKQEFEWLYGRKISENEIQLPYTPETLLKDIKHTGIGKKILKKIMEDLSKTMGGNPASVKTFVSVVEEMPLRNLMILSNGELGSDAIEGILMIANGKKIKGYLKLIKSGKKTN